MAPRLGSRKAPPPDDLRCTAIAKGSGERCRCARVDGEWCRAHNPLEPAETRFGSPVQAREAAIESWRDRGRYPRLHEIVEREIERRAQEIVGAALDALTATALLVDKDGGEHIHEDARTRLAAAVALMDRGLGRPPTSGTLDVQSASVQVTLDARDPQARAALADVLRRRPASAE